MVLQPNFSKRVDAENIPPAAPHLVVGKSMRFRTSVQDASRRRRARTNGAPRTVKYAVGQAKRNSNKASATSFRFSVTTYSGEPATADVEMQEAIPLLSTTPVILPKQLGRPAYRPISKEALSAVDPENADIDVSFFREVLEEFGPDMLRVLGGVSANPMKNSLPKEIAISVQDTTSSLPTHMMAIYGPPPKKDCTEKRKITLYPVHSIVLAAYCSKLPAFGPTSDDVMSVMPGENLKDATIPIRPICLPSPQTYPQLSSFLYTKRTDALLASMMPCLPPRTLEDEPSQIPTFAIKLAGTYTIQALLQHTMVVHGLWQNVYALGIFDDSLWETIDLAWEVLLTAIAIGTGNPQEVIIPASPPAPSS